MAFIISVAINVVVVLICCLPIVIIFEIIWLSFKEFMEQVFKVDWQTHEEKYKKGLLPKEYKSMYEMVKIKLEEEIHSNFEYRKQILRKVERDEEEAIKLRESYRR